MPAPFRIGVIQLAMEPVAEMLEHARALDRAGFDTLWLAEPQFWWRKHSLEARSSTAVSALVAAGTERLAVGWGIISPYSRHPLQIAAEARVLQEVAGEGRFYLGLGPSKIFMKHAGIGVDGAARPYTAVREAIEIVREALSGKAVSYRGREFVAEIPPLKRDAEAPRWRVPLYIAGTGPRLQRASGEIADGLLTASITTPAFVRYARANMEEGARLAGRSADELDLGSVVVASVGLDRRGGREGAREIAAMYLANKVQNIRGSADVLLELAGLTREEIEPIAAAMESGGRQAAARAVTDEILDRVKPVAGTPEECIAAIEEYREAGCTHLMLELWGDDRLEQIALFEHHVLPHVTR
ncbi:MAG TPA: LLM class flavin-dependent oxidoreductase [Gaiellaceae bacterium]|nr:LLM class flavin-dependent oxidoreductase [Gaiellaceae bacterium]